MKKVITYLFILSCISNFIKAQNVAINSTGAAPRNCAMLDILSSNTGLLIPTVVLTNVTTYAPLTGTAVDGLLVYSSAAPAGGNGSGYYYWSTSAAKWINLVDNLAPGDPWYANGNTGTTPSSAAYGTAANNNFIGTTDNKAFVFVCNNLERMRINPADGEVVIGAQTSGLPGDLLCGVATAANPWATNGYSTFDGGATYGQITGGTTLYAGVQGEYNGTNNAGAGVRGSIINNTAGTGLATIISGVNGISTSIGS